MKEKFVKYFMDVAERTAQLSYATRLKVGTVIVKNNRIISCGYNGMPAGWTPNDCEYPVSIDSVEFSKLPLDEQARFTYNSNKNEWEGLKTYDELIHSEINCLGQLTRTSESGKNCIMFCTHSPCIQCAKSIYISGIKELYYKFEYRNKSGIEFLLRCGVSVVNVNDT
jgi:dCMP deaminase